MVTEGRGRRLVAVCNAGLRRVLQTEKADLYLYASNGHGVWEATTENLLAPGPAVLIPGTGHFSEQWALQAKATGRRPRWRAQGRRVLGRGLMRVVGATNTHRVSCNYQRSTNLRTLAVASVASVLTLQRTWFAAGTAPRKNRTAPCSDLITPCGLPAYAQW